MADGSIRRAGIACGILRRVTPGSGRVQAVADLGGGAAPGGLIAPGG